MMRFEKILVRLQLSIVLLVSLTAVVWGPRELVRSVLGAGPPLVGELTPRQVPYRGYLEQNGAPVNDPGLAMRFRFYGIDGGILHEESRAAVPLQNGQFSVELGDLTPIPMAVSQENFVDLEVAVGATPVVLTGRQRILTVPFSARALDAWRAENANAASSATGVLATQIVPPGTVVAFAGTTPPPGWLRCDGAAVAKAQYPALYAAIGDAHGTPDSLTFNLPDYRGRFLRGLDLGTGRDVDRDSRTAMASGGNTGDQVGTVEPDELRAHTHVLNKSDFAGGGQRVTFGSANNSAEPTPVQYTGGSETRPKNANVNWMVKY